MNYEIMSCIGNRTINEDYVEVCCSNGSVIFILADGLGGHGFGEEASKTAVSIIKNTFLNNQNKNAKELLKSAFTQADIQLKKMQVTSRDKTSFKTTMAVLVVGCDYILWGYIGDSRVYHFEKTTLIERSFDHSVPQMLVKTGAIKDKKIRSHQDRNRLLKVLGGEGIPNYFITDFEPRNKEAAFLLCTDGFWERITEREMKKCLKKSKHSEEWLKKMEEIVLKKGRNADMDNFSAIAVIL